MNNADPANNVFVPEDDIAVLRTASWDLTSVVAADAAAMHRDATRQMSGGWAFGYGWYTDSNLDNQLRNGSMSNISYSGNTIWADYGSSDPHICSGDSGGPLKLGTTGSTHDGITFGVTALANGWGNCQENWAGFSNVGRHINWIVGKLASNACVNKTYTQGGVQTKLCW